MVSGGSHFKKGVSEGHPKKVTPKRLTSLITVLLLTPVLAHNSVKEGTMPLSLPDLNLCFASKNI